MKPLSARLTPLQLSWRLLAVGLLLIAVNPLIVFFAPLDDDTKVLVSTVLGYTCMAIGFVLLTPLAVLAVERVFGPIVAKLLGVDRRLLYTQLSSNLWRTVGASVALTIGLGLFVATQTWGISMLQPFIPGQWMPDLVVGFPKGISDADIVAVRQTPGVRADQCLPLAIEQPKLTGDITRSDKFTNATRADSVIIVGFDPQAALGGDKPMFDFTYVEGSRDAALSKLAEGRNCLIADFLQTETGLKVGDTFKLSPPNAPETTLEYTVAGVVAEPGVHWLSKGNLRRRGGSMAGMVFTSYDQARRDYALAKHDFFWMNLQPNASVEDVQKALEPIALRNGGEAPPEDNFAGRAPVPGAGNSRSPVFVKSADAVSRMVQNRAAEVIWGMSQLPLVTLAIASIGMINTVMASVRARSWDFGVLRSLGLTRLALFRLVIAEAILVGLVACVLSFALGISAGYCATGLARYVYRHGGYVVPLVIPWARLAWACGATLLLCLIAAVVPAIITGCTEPLKLLRAGRAAA